MESLVQSWNVFRDPFQPLLEAYVGGLYAHILKHLRHAADIFAYRHVIVVQDYYHRLAARRGVRKSLVRQAARKRAVADDRDDIIVPAGERSCPRHAQRNGNRI